MKSNLGTNPHQPAAARESGSALILALLVMVIMTLLGLAFALLGETEAKISRNSRDSAQALFVAEGGARLVRKWFEAPSGSYSYLVPTTSQVNRTLRVVDPEGDGTYVGYSSAASPWNVTYKQGTDDLFEKPYKGVPKDLFLGTEANPDIRISESGSTGERAFLTTLNNTLYTIFPASNQRGRITQIDVYSPPMLKIGASFVRGGIVTIKVTAGIFEQAGTTGEKRIAQRVVKAVLAELPYAPAGALQTCSTLSANGEFAGHWGLVTSVGAMDLAANLNVKVNSGIPYALNQQRYIARDMNLDGTLQYGAAGVGTPDDQDGNGTLDFDEWIASPDVEDPWVKFLSEGDILSGGSAISPGCATADCQPSPFYQSPSTFGTGTTDHSNLFKNVAQDLCPTYEYALWKEVAQSGAPNTYYFASDGPGTGTYKLNGSGSSMSFATAANGRYGLMFFDTSDNTPPRDADLNGIWDNLSDPVVLSGGGWQSGGFIYLNANFSSNGSGSVSTQKQMIAPPEPYIDSNGNGVYDDTEYFIDLTYPGSPGGSYPKNGMRRVADGYTRQDPVLDAGTAGKWNADVNLYGLMFINGNLDSQGNWIYFGAVVAKSTASASGMAGTPDYYYDDRMRRGMWPPADLALPRTIVTAWQTE